VDKRKEVYERLEKFYGVKLDNGLKWMTNNNPTTSLYPDLSGTFNI